MRRGNGSHGKHAVLKRWSDWNLLNVGKPSCSQRVSAYWYKDNLLFRRQFAVGRIIFTEDSYVVLLGPDLFSFYGIEEHFDGHNVYHVPFIGVGGVGGAVLPEYQLLNLLRDELQAQVRHTVEQVRKMTFASCMGWESARQSIVHENPNLRYSPWPINVLRAIEHIYVGLKAALDTNWPKLTINEVIKNCDQIVAARIAAYNDPERQRQRDRREAREEAKRALGVAA